MDVLGRVREDPEGPVLGESGIAPNEVLRRLEEGESPSQVADALGLVAADVIAAIAREALILPEGPPLVQGEPRRPSLKSALSEGSIATLLPKPAEPARLALAAGLLQVLDFWDESHEAAQRADDLGESRTAAYWHGIAHRREPDPGNAAYWFRRVGRHPLFATLGAAALAAIREDGGTPEATNVVRGGTWDPSAMIELCRTARPGSPAEATARRLQRIEMALLLEASASAVLGR